MPPKVVKQKSASKDGVDKNKVKKNSAVDDTESPEIKDEIVVNVATPLPDIIVPEDAKTEIVVMNDDIDIKYEEPVLTLIIVERYLPNRCKVIVN